MNAKQTAAKHCFELKHIKIAGSIFTAQHNWVTRWGSSRGLISSRDWGANTLNEVFAGVPCSEVPSAATARNLLEG